jgi:HSP20 family protein
MGKASSKAKKTIPILRAPDLWQALHDDVDRVFTRHPVLRRWFYPEDNWSAPRGFLFPVPAVDMTGDDKGYTITAELPGLEDKDVEVTVSGDFLVIKGEKHYEKDEKDKDRHMAERAFGSFRRSFVVPSDVDRDEIAAELAKGVLAVTLPKTAAATKQQKVQVKAAA